MELSVLLSNCSTHWHRRAKESVVENQRIEPITSRGVPRFGSVEMEIAVVFAQVNGNSKQVGEMFLGKDRGLGSVREDTPFAQKDHTLNFGNDF